MRYYAVTGRLSGDDEDTLLLVRAADNDGAADEYTFELRAIRNVEPDDSTPVHVNAMVWSATEIFE